MRFDKSLRPGESIRGSKKSARSNRGHSPRGGHDATMGSFMDRTMNFMKEGEEVCRYVNFNTFKSIYGHGMELKFVKLLFLFLKKQIDKFIE